ncbi:hypothetical protein SDC9_77016 [bioreactor metagenome]|uniref:Uncharacterized protein n=1 Tax=bioreactor metagenome TaxID=1076179 RepID=A0A644YPN5_9ZZZZ
MTRIADRRHSRIAHLSDRLSTKQLIHQLRNALLGIVFMEADLGCIHFEMRQQFPRIARVLRRNQIHFAQYLYGTEGHILQITDWCRH